MTAGCSQPLSIAIARSMLSKRFFPQQAPHIYQVAYAQTTLGMQVLALEILGSKILGSKILGSKIQ